MSTPANSEPRDVLQRGADLLVPVLVPHGFHFRFLATGQSSGGAFAEGEFVRGDRRLELHYRWSLGLVRYHIAALSLKHVDYMRVLNRPGENRYPNFAGDPLASFEALRHDLDAYCADFLNGAGDEFRECVERQQRYESLTPLQKLEFGVA